MENNGNSIDLKAELETMFNNCLENLKQDRHDEVNEIFTFFFQNDMRLKEKLAKAFMPGTDEDIMDPNKVQSLIELQAIYNSYHLNLFNSITDNLIEKFSKSLELMDNDKMEEGTKLSFDVQKIVRYYEVKLEKLMAPIDTFQGATFNDLKESYKTVIGRRNEMISQITQRVIEKEQKLMMDQNE